MYNMSNMEDFMIRGLYASGWSMMANNRKMDVISNNLANVNTNGFKKDSAIFESFTELLAKRVNDYRSTMNPSGKMGTMSISSDVGEVFTYYNQGQLSNTGNRLDFAIHDSGNAFFTIATAASDGTIRLLYTRDGAFTISPQNILVTKEGYPVMGENGPVLLQDGEFIIDENGRIIQDGVMVDRLLIRSFTDTTTLRKVGSNMVEITEQTEEQPFSGSILQGYLEQSNVNIIREMVDMITVLRAYEANQKMLQIQDGTLEKAVNEVGVVR
jgi:flagellar basal-body rod protein FlgF